MGSDSVNKYVEESARGLNYLPQFAQYSVSRYVRSLLARVGSMPSAKKPMRKRPLELRALDMVIPFSKRGPAMEPCSLGKP